ncbi:MAG: hypothetical protein OXN80_08180 [bacterium]|nr:hypothetical protein [bacterium]
MEKAPRIGLWLGLLAAASLVMLAAPAVAQETTPAEQTDTGFADVAGGPHAEDIRFIVDRGLTIGCDTEGPRYCPDRDVTRAEIAIFLARALDLDTTLSYRGVFTDVPQDAPYAPHVEIIGALGLSDTRLGEPYRPNDPMLRSEMAVFLQRAFRLSIPEDITASSFSDIAPDASYLEAVEAVLTAGITRGCRDDPPNYCPQDTVRRDTMASFLAGALRGADLRAVLEFAPGRHIMETIAVGEDPWNVWICEGANVTEDVPTFLNRQVSPYFEWLSGGRHQIRFRHGEDPSPEVSAILAGCGDNSRHVKRVEGTHVFVGSPLGGSIAGLAYEGSFDSRDRKLYRNVWVDRGGIYQTGIYAHEIGHTLGWPHNLEAPGARRPLITGMDIMAQNRGLVGTPAHNLFHTGWLDPAEVVLHKEGSAEYSLALPRSGPGHKLLVLPISSNKYIAVGARAKEGYDNNITREGVELYEIDLCNPWVVPCKRVYLPTGSRSEDAVVLDVGDSWAARLSVFYEGRGSFVAFEVKVVEFSDDSYKLQASATPLTSGFSSIDVGKGICGTRMNGIVVCWDWLGFDSSPRGDLVAVSVGDRACGIGVDKTIQCWGRDIGGTPPPEGEFVAINTGGSHTCAIRVDGNVDCWGKDGNGQPISHSPPEGRFLSIGTGWFHACGILEGGTVSCWGRNVYGETQPPSGVFTSVASGGFFSCGLRPDQSLECWGASHPGTSPPQGRFVSVDAGWNHACAMRANGTVECGGANHEGQTSVPDGLFIAVGAGDRRTCGLRPDLSVECWGRDHLKSLIPALEIAH